MSKRPQFLKHIDTAVRSLSVQEADSLTQQAKGTFLFEIKYEDGVEHTTIDLSSNPQVINGKPSNADVTISTDEASFVQLFEGKANVQTLITEGKIEIKGDMVLANKLDFVFQSIRANAEL